MRFIALFITLLLSLTGSAQTTWKSVAPGLQYATLNTKEISPWGTLHAFKIDPTFYQLRLAFAKDYNKQTSSARELAKYMNAVIAVNGGFFTPEKHPIGLRIQQGKIRQGIQKTSWWGVFYRVGEKYQIAALRNFRYRKAINFAVQGGPRLIIDGDIPRLKAGIDDRTAIGITRDQKIILVATESAPLSTQVLAQIMRRPEAEDGLYCLNAINLDGGNSTQMYAQVGPVNVSFSGFSAITDAIGVVKRSK